MLPYFYLHLLVVFLGQLRYREEHAIHAGLLAVCHITHEVTERRWQWEGAALQGLRQPGIGAGPYVAATTPALGSLPPHAAAGAELSSEIEGGKQADLRRRKEIFATACLIPF